LAPFERLDRQTRGLTRQGNVTAGDVTVGNVTVGNVMTGGVHFHRGKILSGMNLREGCGVTTLPFKSERQSGEKEPANLRAAVIL